jgi:type I site-specific restriction endonuclease
VLESQDDVIIVASYGTFATGIDSKNLHHIVLAESIKAEITLRQAIGRGMRKLAEKNSVTVWDLVDGLDGYSIKHSKVREDIYKEQKFEISKRTVDLVETSQSTQ